MLKWVLWLALGLQHICSPGPSLARFNAGKRLIRTFRTMILKVCQARLTTCAVFGAMESSEVLIRH